MMYRMIVTGLLGLALFAGCGEDACPEEEHDHDTGEEVGTPTETLCPTNGTTLTWENFGQAFFADYCTECHSSELTTPEDRMCAPTFHDFDTIQGVRAVADHIDQMAGSGPAATNTEMPPNSKTQPTMEQREQLAEWLACGAP